jgi:hypothetical protein
VLLGFAVGLLPTFRPPRASSPRLLPKALKVPQPSRSAVLLGEPMVPRPSRLAALPKALKVPQPSRSAVLLGEPMVPRPSRLAALPKALMVPQPSRSAVLLGEPMVPRPSRPAALNFAERPIAHFLREPSRTGHQSAIREPIRPRSSS